MCATCNHAVAHNQASPPRSWLSIMVPGDQAVACLRPLGGGIAKLNLPSFSNNSTVLPSGGISTSFGSTSLPGIGTSRRVGWAASDGPGAISWPVRLELRS